MPQVTVSVVIVNWNTKSELIACLRSLREAESMISPEVIVVDNASSDGSAQAAKQAAVDALVLSNPRNVGLAKGNNQGLAESSGDIVVVSNPDVEFLPGAIDALVDLLERRPRAAFAFARLLERDGTVQTCAGTLPTLREALQGRKHQRKLMRSPPTPSFWWDGWAHDDEIQIEHGGEACYAVRRKALDDIGLQDERFVLDWEGLDWCERARDAGWEIWFCPTAQVTHAGSRSIRKVRYRWIIRSHRGMYRYFAKRTVPAVKPLLALLIGARAVVKTLAVSTRRGFDDRYLRADA